MSYTVVSGDTLGKIAQKFGTTYQELAKYNGISDPNKISVGQIIKIPNRSSSSSSSSSNTYTVVSGDSLSKIAQKFGTTYQEIAKLNGISDPNKISVGQVLIIPRSSSTTSSVSNTTSSSNVSTSTIQVKNSNKISEALKKSQWSSKADSLSVAFQVIIDNGYSVECAIGLMANLLAEGNYGIVEYSFSKSHKFNFYLPSGGVKCKTIKDIEYVRDWPTTSKETSGNLKKDSCGFGSVQWSFERRVNFAKLCLTIMKSDSDVNDNNWAIAEAKFITQELKNGYYSAVEKAAKNAGGSVEDWAEAFCDKYERPAGADLKMTGTGSACVTRRKNAKNIYEYLINNNAFD